MDVCSLTKPPPPQPSPPPHAACTRSADPQVGSASLSGRSLVVFWCTFGGCFLFFFPMIDGCQGLSMSSSMEFDCIRNAASQAFLNWNKRRPFTGRQVGKKCPECNLEAVAEIRIWRRCTRTPDELLIFVTPGHNCLWKWGHFILFIQFWFVSGTVHGHYFMLDIIWWARTT